MTSPAPDAVPGTAPETGLDPGTSAASSAPAVSAGPSPRDTWADSPTAAGGSTFGRLGAVGTGRTADKQARGRHGAFLRYRAMAWTTGTFLLVLVFVAVPLKYAAHSDGLMAIVGPGHGFLFMVYLLATFDLARRVRWSLLKLLLVAAAGTIPFLSFITEHRIARELHGGRDPEVARR